MTFLLFFLIWWLLGIIASALWVYDCKKNGKTVWWKQAIFNSFLGIINWSIL